MVSHALLFVLVFFSVLFGIVITRLGKRERIYVLLMHLFVCFARVGFCPFSLPLGVRGLL